MHRLVANTADILGGKDHNSAAVADDDDEDDNDDNDNDDYDGDDNEVGSLKRRNVMKIKSGMKAGQGVVDCSIFMTHSSNF